MIEIKCPRCGQYWYHNDWKEGRARLCERCADHLQYKRRQRGLIDVPFLIVAGMLFYVDLSLLALSVLMPAPFATVMLIYGFLQLGLGMIALSAFGFRSGSRLDRWLASEWFSANQLNTNWKFGRWLVLITLSGLVCFLAAGAFLGFK
jgi:hypothetical protein